MKETQPSALAHGTPGRHQVKEEDTVHTDGAQKPRLRQGAAHTLGRPVQRLEKQSPKQTLILVKANIKTDRLTTLPREH
jgi:hypothetical protein